MENLFVKKSLPLEFPDLPGWYDTDKGNLYWFRSEKTWSCREDRISEEYPIFWYEQAKINPQKTPAECKDEVKNLLELCHKLISRFNGTTNSEPVELYMDLVDAVDQFNNVDLDSEDNSEGYFISGNSLMQSNGKGGSNHLLNFGSIKPSEEFKIVLLRSLNHNSKLYAGQTKQSEKTHCDENPVEFMRDKINEYFHDWRNSQTDSTIIEIDGNTLGDITFKAELETKKKFPWIRYEQSSPVSLEVETVIDLIKQSIPETTSDTPIYQCGVSDGKRQAIDIILQSQQPASIAFLSEEEIKQLLNDGLNIQSSREEFMIDGAIWLQSELRKRVIDPVRFLIWCEENDWTLIQAPGGTHEGNFQQKGKYYSTGQQLLQKYVDHLTSKPKSNGN